LITDLNAVATTITAPVYSTEIVPKFFPKPTLCSNKLTSMNSPEGKGVSEFTKVSTGDIASDATTRKVLGAAGFRIL
jgi:hypothetical protein